MSQETRRESSQSEKRQEQKEISRQKRKDLPEGSSGNRKPNFLTSPKILQPSLS